MELDDIQKIYVKICSGYEKFFIDDRECFLKHHNYSDRFLLREKYNEGILIAKKNGIKTAQDYLDFYIEKGWWSKKKEDEIRNITSFIEGLKKSKEKLILPSQREQVSKTIQEEEEKLSKLTSEKKSIIPITAEEYANKYYNRYYLHYSLYSDIEFKTFFAPSEEYFIEQIGDDIYNDIWEKIIDVINLFEIKNIKYIAASGFFQNLIMLTGKEMSAIDFYGKPVSDLTINQIDLFSYAASYRRSINNASEKIPDYILSDPLNLISWCEGGDSSSGRAKNLMDRAPNKNKTRGERSGRISSIVGASESDYKKLGIENKSSGRHNLLADAASSGGEMSINQLIKKTDNLK
jgi:hypothetical protein